ncbi:MAG: ABC transporter permease [Actinobacteria bacterium]|nr:ABC transporter permease [Actinomycetota bacterium]
MASSRWSWSAVLLGLTIAGVLTFLALPLISLAFFDTPVVLWRKLDGTLARQALVLSLTSSALSLVFTIGGGTPLAYWLSKNNFRGKRFVEAGLQLTIVIPASVAGVGLLLVFGRAGLLGDSLGWVGLQVPFTIIAVVIAQVFSATALYVTAARQGFDGVDDQLIATSRTLGQSPWETFRRVSVPLAAPGLLTGAALGWARALGEFGATLVFAGNLPGATQTMPLAIFTALESDLATAVAISLLLLVVALVPLVLVRYAAQRLERRRDQADRDESTGVDS